MSVISHDAAGRARRFAGPVVSVVSLIAVVWWALHQQAPQWPTGLASLSLLVLAVGAYAGVTAVRGVRWYAILHRAGVDASMADTQALIVVGYMGNTVLPARGGELLRMFLLGECTGSSRVTILGTIIAERVLDVFALLALLLLLAAVTTSSAHGALHVGSSVAIAIGGLLAVALVLLVVWRMARPDGRLRALVRRLAPLTLATRNLLGVQGLLLGLLTAAIWVGEGLVYWLVGGSLDLHLNIFQACFLVVLSSLVAIIPAAPGYAGTYDAAIQFGLKTLHVRGGRAVSFGLLVRLVIFVPITLAGLVLIVVRYGGLSSLTGLHQKVSAQSPGESPEAAVTAGLAGGVSLLRSSGATSDTGLELVPK